MGSTCHEMGGSPDWESRFFDEKFALPTQDHLDREDNAHDQERTTPQPESRQTRGDPSGEVLLFPK
jgi:hypothetical protein